MTSGPKPDEAWYSAMFWNRHHRWWLAGVLLFPALLAIKRYYEGDEPWGPHLLEAGIVSLLFLAASGAPHRWRLRR